MNTKYIDEHAAFHRSVCEHTDQALSEYFQKNTENLQFPTLLTMVTLQMKLDAKDTKEVDPMIRTFVRNHPEYYVSRGAKGGIMKIESHQKKVDAKAAKEAQKKLLQDQIDAKVAASSSTNLQTVSQDNEESSSDE